MVELLFSAEAQKLLAEGALRYMTSKTGEILPILVDVSTSRTFEIARVVARNSSLPILPAKFILDGIVGGAQIVQTHRGFQKTYHMIEAVQQSLGVLQTTTAILGCSVAVTGVISAVNLYQTLQLRKEVQALRKDLTKGFLDLQQIVTEHNANILALIEHKAFEERKHELEKAYAQFTHAMEFVEFAIKVEDPIARNISLGTAANTMNQSLAIYSDLHLLNNMNAAGKLRQSECAWTIQQMIAYVFQLQNELDAAAHCLSKLQTKIEKNSLAIVDACESQAELDFIFPELMRIHQQDLEMLKHWRTQLNIVQALPPNELHLLPIVDNDQVDILEETLEVPEAAAYAELKSTSDFNSLRDQLRFLIQPDLRHDYEKTIAQRANEVGYSAIGESNLQEASDQAIANLYWYLKNCCPDTEPLN